MARRLFPEVFSDGGKHQFAATEKGPKARPIPAWGSIPGGGYDGHERQRCDPSGVAGQLARQRAQRARKQGQNCSPALSLCVSNNTRPIWKSARRRRGVAANWGSPPSKECARKQPPRLDSKCSRSVLEFFFHMAALARVPLRGFCAQRTVSRARQIARRQPCSPHGI